MIRFQTFAEKLDFSPYRSMCDIAGATAQLSIAVAQGNPYITATSFDLPLCRAGRAEVDRRRGTLGADKDRRRRLFQGRAQGRSHHDGNDPDWIWRKR